MSPANFESGINRRTSGKGQSEEQRRLTLFLEVVEVKICNQDFSVLLHVELVPFEHLRR